MRQIVFALIFLLIGSATAWAGTDNPDLLDVDTEFYSPYPRDASENHASIDHGGDGGPENSASGHIDNSDGDFATVFWDLYEPDTLSRRENRGTQSQRAYVEVGFYTWSNSGATGSWDSTSVEDCRASTKVVGTEGDPDRASWRVRCRGALAEMGLSEGQLERLDRLLGRYVNTSRDSIAIQGRGPVEDD